MAENKVLREDKNKTSFEEGAKAFNDIISFDTLGAILGIFFPLCSVAYILIKQYAGNFWLGVALLALGTFFSMWIVFFGFAYANRKKKAKELLQKQKDNLVTQLNYCRDCSLKKIDNGLEYRKLFTHEEVMKFEEKLVDDPSPSKTAALVYTSDLSTIIRRKEKMIENIRENGAKYYVVYFKNTSGEELKELDDLNKENLILINAKDYPELNNSMDAQLLSFSDFEILVLVDSTRKYIQGFFSVDNVSKNAIIEGRSSHDSECRERCNYGKNNQEPLYKVLSDEKAKKLFDDIENLMKGGNLHE